MGFRVLVSLHPAIQATGPLTLAPAGLPPAEHTSLCWTHNAACGFPRTALSCLLRLKAYETYPAGATFDIGRRTRQLLNSRKVSYSHCLLHRFQPKPFRFRACSKCRRIFISNQSLMKLKHSPECPTAK